MADNRLVGRFAPSPTGRMHAGNIFAALMSWLIVKSRGGSIVLRIEDLDVERSKRSFAEHAMRDFEFLGLTWDEGPYYQQGREEAYEEAYRTLCEKGEVYPCFCTRADLHAASAPHRGEKLVYAGTCRDLSEAEVRRRSQERAPAWRLQVPDSVYSIDDLVQGTFSQNLLHDCGDFIVRRSDGLFAYQLAVVVDDAEQGVNCVVRDRRLSKRDRDAGIEELCTRFGSAAGVIGHIAWLVGLQECDEPVTPEQLLEGFRIPDFPDKVQIQWM